MKIVADLHTHTVASTHAFSTIHEMTTQAIHLGYKAMAVTDHGPAMPDSPHRWYFTNVMTLPYKIGQDFLLLKGVEANAIKLDGSIDMDTETLEELDWVIVSLHQKCIPQLTEVQATQLWLGVAQNPLVDMIGHSEQWQYKYDYDRVTKAFAQAGKIVEMNANSAVSRPGNEDNLRELAISCKRNNTRVAITSDAHSVYGLGNEGRVVQMLQEISFPKELVINTSMKRMMQVLREHEKKVVNRIAGEFSWE